MGRRALLGGFEATGCCFVRSKVNKTRDIPFSAAEAALQGLQRGLQLSPGAPVALVVANGKALLYRRGARILDEKVVEDVLGLLEDHPKVAEKLAHAIQTHLTNDEQQFRGVLDDLRFCLEQLLRGILKNHKPLEKQKTALGVWLEERGVHPEIRNMYSTLLSAFANYQNDAVKHDENWSPPEVEFMVYLAGTFMRMLLQLESR